MHFFQLTVPWLIRHDKCFGNVQPIYESWLDAETVIATLRKHPVKNTGFASHVGLFMN